MEIITLTNGLQVLTFNISDTYLAKIEKEGNFTMPNINSATTTNQCVLFLSPSTNDKYAVQKFNISFSSTCDNSIVSSYTVVKSGETRDVLLLPSVENIVFEKNKMENFTINYRFFYEGEEYPSWGIYSGGTIGENNTIVASEFASTNSSSMTISYNGSENFPSQFCYGIYLEEWSDENPNVSVIKMLASATTNVHIIDTFPFKFVTGCADDYFSIIGLGDYDFTITVEIYSGGSQHISFAYVYEKIDTNGCLLDGWCDRYSTTTECDNSCFDINTSSFTYNADCKNAYDIKFIFFIGDDNLQVINMSYNNQNLTKIDDKAFSVNDIDLKATSENNKFIITIGEV